MSLARNLFSSSLGKKYIMAVTGLALIGFVFGHLVGNLQIFAHPDALNGYAHFLQSLGPILWFVRGFLLLCVGLHIWTAVQLTLENRAARPTDYGFKHTVQATLASRTMRLSGLVVLAFIIYHLAHFTLGVAQAETFKTQFAYTLQNDFHIAGIPVVAAGTVVHDVHTMVVLGFQNIAVSIFYVIAIGLLSLHLWHGAESVFQTLGLRTSRWGCTLRCVTRLIVIAYFMGNIAIPAAILGGCVQSCEIEPCAVTNPANFSAPERP